MKHIYIGQDNGVTSTIGILIEGEKPLLLKTPVVLVQDYTKAKKNISRLISSEYYNLLEKYSDKSLYQTLILIERPLVNPERFQATASALRCHEAMLIIVELLELPYRFIDSKEWQKKLLPEGTEKEDLKKMSLEIGNRYFPEFKDFKHLDRDGLLIAKYAQLNNL